MGKFGLFDWFMFWGFTSILNLITEIKISSVFIIYKIYIYLFYSFLQNSTKYCIKWGALDQRVQKKVLKASTDEKANQKIEAIVDGLLLIQSIVTPIAVIDPLNYGKLFLY